MVHNNKVVNAIYDDDGNPVEHPISSDDLARLHDDGICAQVAGLDGILFSGGLSERALMLHISMAMGSISVCNDSCALFEAMPLSIAAAFTTLALVTAGKRSGVTAEQLSKVFCIPHNDAARTLSVTIQLVQYNTDSSPSRNVSTNDRALRYRKIKLKFFTDTLFATKGAKSTRGNICVQIFVSDKGFVSLYPMKDQ